MTTRPKKRIFTWHIHGSYLFYLSQGNFEIFIPVNETKTEGYYGRGLTFPFGDNVREVEANQVKNIQFDIILFQTDRNYLIDQYEILSEEQRKLPRIFLKHEAPGFPTNKIVVSDPDVHIVHVTNFNNVMWDNNGLHTSVIMHGVTDNGYHWNGKLNKGLVVINNLGDRGRQLGADIFKSVSQVIPLDLIGMGNEEFGGNEVLHPYLPDFMADYRFFFNPIRYSSFPLSVCEAMMTGLPVVALSITELPIYIKNGVNGFIHTDIDYLIEKMKKLLNDHEAAKIISNNARQTALESFSINRFIKEWDCVFAEVTEQKLYIE